MKRKRKLFSSMAFVLSLVMLVVSGAIFVHTATQQSVSSSLQVTFNGQNVDFTANGWYQVKNTASHPYLVNGSGTEGISLKATDPQSSTATLSTQANTSVELSASNTYVLFTYKFTNTASNGAYGMEVTLAGSTPQNNNIDVKYLVSSADATDYYSSNTTDNEKISALDDKVRDVTGTSSFSNVFIQAGHFKYFYILVSLKDNTINGTYNNTLSWTVVCSNKTEEQNNVTVTVSGPGLQNDTYKVYYLKTETTTDNGSIIYSNLTGWTLIDGAGTISVPYGYCLTISGCSEDMASFYNLPTSSSVLNLYSVETSGEPPIPIQRFMMCNVSKGEQQITHVFQDGSMGYTFSSITEDFSLYFSAWVNANA